MLSREKDEEEDVKKKTEIINLMMGAMINNAGRRMTRSIAVMIFALPSIAAHIFQNQKREGKII